MCLIAERAYYSGYAGNPEMIFKPGMVGTVGAVVPKVRRVRRKYLNPAYDNRPYFLAVDYDCPVTKQVQRVALNFCNAKKVLA